MEPLPVPERDDKPSLRKSGLQPSTPIPSHDSRSSSKFDESDLLTPCSSSKSAESDPCTPFSSSDSADSATVSPDTESEDTGERSSLGKRQRGTLPRTSPAPKRLRTDILDENRLCEPCQQIDFQKVLDVDVLSLQKESDGILLADLGTRCNDLSTAKDCPLCHLFYQSRVQQKITSSQYQLRVYSYLQSTKSIAFGLSKQQHRAKDVPCLGVVPAKMKGKRLRVHTEAIGHLFCVKEDAIGVPLFRPQILKETAALSPVKDWLDFCTSHHSVCKKDGGQVSGLKLLDCETFDVVPAPANASYVALSYVWGVTAGHTDTPVMKCDGGRRLDPRITRTILDATAVARRLGYSYLWVDKLCIDQGNVEEKHHQISHMDSIYGSADLTIIAACGQDSHYGLPGINGTPRIPGRNVAIGQFKVFSSMRHSHDDIRSSQWVTRGWTLQEACLSPRRLVFSDNQLYFECNTMNCSESIVPNLDLIHDRKRNIYPCFQSGILSMNMGRRFAGNAKRSYEQNKQYMDLVVQYTKRSLTFEDDRPKAFAGIMRYFARKDFLELWGVPYGFALRNAGDSIAWMTRGIFIMNLLWAHQRTTNPSRNARDRADISVDMILDLSKTASIPSWSWMGWRGEISFPQSSIIMTDKVHEMRLEIGKDSWIHFNHFASMNPDRDVPYHVMPPKILLLDVDCVKPSEVSLDKSGKLQVLGRETQWYISRGPLQPGAIYELLQSGRWELLLLACTFAMRGFLMIVEKLENCAVRTGICIVQSFRYWKGERKSIRLA